jgi:phenylalanyl-tRNA synthetase beta chain
LSEAEAYLRTDLVPVLLGRLEHNWSRGHRDVRLYEIGSVFQALDDASRSRESDAHPFLEEIRVALVLTGLRQPAHWSGSEGDFEIWDLKGLLEAMTSELDLGEIRQGVEPEGERGLPFGTERWLGENPLCILKAGRPVGVAGQVRPEGVDAPVWAAPVFALELKLDAVGLDDRREYRDLPTYPAVARDLALVLERDVAASSVADQIRAAAPDTLESLSLFDVYEGEKIGGGKRSLAWRLVFRAEDRTLTDDEVEEGLSSITVNLENRFDVRIRSS